jgi:C1A family cysteine protease
MVYPSFSSLLSFSLFGFSLAFNPFHSFIEHFNKSYTTPNEFSLRNQTFYDNLAFIDNFNSNDANNVKLAINSFADLSHSEFQSKFSPLRHFWNKCDDYSSSEYDIDFAEFDWRNIDGIVSPIRDQGQCGSCWSFATLACVESTWAIQTGNLYDLSEQELVSCSSGRPYWNQGCNGGITNSAFRYVIDNGISFETTLPYTAKDDKCPTNLHKSPVSLSTCYNVEPENQIDLKSAVSSNSVVAVAIQADSRVFQFYSSGIITSEECGDNLNHAVAIVGYGEEKDGTKFWTVRNSWGTSWGEDGYVRILREDKENGNSICGIAGQPSFIL